MECDNLCCFGKILKLIDKLQKCSNCDGVLDNSCSRPYLGTPTNLECYNTRPVSFYNCNNQLITVDYTAVVDGTPLTGTSGVFRVERVDGCCVVLRLLIDNPDTTATNRPYIGINQTITINLDCVCAMRCLGDTIIDL